MTSFDPMGYQAQPTTTTYQQPTFGATATRSPRDTAFGSQSPYAGQSTAGRGLALPNSTADDQTWATLVHVIGLFSNFVGPLVVLLAKGDQSPRIRHAAKQALNFQISIAIGYAIAGVLSIVLVGVILFPILAVLHVVLPILAARSEARGQSYTYPFALNIIK